MRILLMHPNYHSGGAEIAGNWPPAWVAYLAGSLKKEGYDNIRFVDAMTNDLSDEQIRSVIAAEKPDVIGTTAITPSIYKAERILEIAKEESPDTVTVLGGIHATFMYQQVFVEAPWVDCIVRGEGEHVFVDLIRTIDEGRWPEDCDKVKGIAWHDGENVVANPAAPPITRLDTLDPDWGVLDWDQYHYIPMENRRVAVPNFARGCPYTCTFCSQWKFWRTYRVRKPKDVVDEIEHLYREHSVGFFILADEEPTIHRKKFIEFCEELASRNLDIYWGINTRVTDILRDEEYLPLYRRAGLIHISLGTEAAAQMNLNRFRKETTIEQNKKAIELLRKHGIVSEAQFIVGMENETKETLEETYQMCQDWAPDMANWAMYTPWPFSDMFAELDDKVEIYDFDKYNFVTPIIKPDQMDRAEVLDHVMHNYRRFYMKKSFFSYPWTLDKAKRKYLLGCLKAYALSGFKRKFYDLGRVNYWGSKKTVDFDFDESKTTIVQPSLGEWKQAPRKKLERARNVAREAQVNKQAMRERAKEEAAQIKANGGQQANGGSGDSIPTRGGEPASLNKRREREGREQRTAETTAAE